jgi:TM2 domain-containing membrane protein YozV
MINKKITRNIANISLSLTIIFIVVTIIEISVFSMKGRIVNDTFGFAMIFAIVSSVCNMLLGDE